MSNKKAKRQDKQKNYRETARKVGIHINKETDRQQDRRQKIQSDTYHFLLEIYF